MSIEQFNQPLSLSWKEVAECAGHKVMMAVDIYFVEERQYATDFRLTAQASSNLLIKYLYYIKNIFIKHY